MRARAVPEWMSNEISRLSIKFERYKPTCNGYNRIQSIRLSKSVTQMLNNPLPTSDQIGRGGTCSPEPQRVQRGVLSCSESEWEEVYPAVKFSRSSSSESKDDDVDRNFTFYRNCSTRIT